MSRRYWKLEEYDLSQATLQDFEKRIPDAIYNTLTLPENAIRSASIKI